MHTGTRKRLNAIGGCGWDLKALNMSYKEGKVSRADFRKYLDPFAKKGSASCPTHLWLYNGAIHKSSVSMELILK